MCATKVSRAFKIFPVNTGPAAGSESDVNDEAIETGEALSASARDDSVSVVAASDSAPRMLRSAKEVPGSIGKALDPATVAFSSVVRVLDSLVVASVWVEMERVVFAVRGCGAVVSDPVAVASVWIETERDSVVLPV